MASLYVISYSWLGTSFILLDRSNHQRLLGKIYTKSQQFAERYIHICHLFDNLDMLTLSSLVITKSVSLTFPIHLNDIDLMQMGDNLLGLI